MVGGGRQFSGLPVLFRLPFRRSCSLIWLHGRHHAAPFPFRGIGNVALLAPLIGITFSALDVRYRDVRDGVSGVIYSKPTTSLALLVGRATAVVTVYWLMALAAIGTVQVWGIPHQARSASLFAPVDWDAVLWFLVLDALPTMIFWTSLVILLAVRIRNRLIVALLAFSVLAAWLAASLHAPAWIADAIAMVSSLGVPASELAPAWPDPSALTQRGVLLVLAAGCIGIAAAGCWRLDHVAKWHMWLAGGGLLACGVVAVTMLIVVAARDLSLRQRWLDAHQHAAQTLSWPELHQLSGVVALVPGEALKLDLRLEVRAASPGPLAFSLNPGMAVLSVTRGAYAVPFQHEDGLLLISTPPRHVASTDDREVLRLRSRGIPDPAFAWLDSVVDPRRESRSNALRLLGSEADLFTKDFVALGPELHWLPSPFPNLSNANDARFFLDLTVYEPDGWTVVGPDGKRVRDGVQFRPDGRVAGVGVLAGRYRTVAATAGNIRSKLLLERSQGRLTSLAGGVEAVHATIFGMLEDAERLGIPWPYRSLALVEVPARLRAWGGGTLLPWSRAWPGVMMMPETGLPSARLDQQLGPAQSLAVYIVNDRTGADPSRGFARNVMQATAAGDGAAALNLLCESLVQALVGTDSHVTEPYRFRGLKMTSAHLFDEAVAMPEIARMALHSAISGHLGPVAFAIPGAPPYGELPPNPGELRLISAGTGTGALPATEARETIQRITAVTRILLDTLGREGVGLLLARLLERYSASGFTLEDFSDELDQVADGRLPGGWVAHRFRQGGTAGHVVSEVTVKPGINGSGTLARLHIYNAETAAGVVRVGYGRGVRGPGFSWEMTPPIFVQGRSAVEVGLITPWTPDEFWLQSYLARNGSGMRLVESRETPGVAQRVFVGVRPSEWRPKPATGIVVDDFDDAVVVPGFAARFPGDRTSGWRRMESSSSWGRYRRTVAWADSGSGVYRVGMPATLPEDGRWSLDFHVPDPERIGARRSPLVPAAHRLPRTGVQQLEIRQGGVLHHRSVDVGSAEPGWLRIDTLDLAAGRVEVFISDVTTGDAAIVDAIRWTD